VVLSRFGVEAPSTTPNLAMLFAALAPVGRTTGQMSAYATIPIGAPFTLAVRPGEPKSDRAGSLSAWPVAASRKRIAERPFASKRRPRALTPRVARRTSLSTQSETLA